MNKWTSVGLFCCVALFLWGGQANGLMYFGKDEAGQLIGKIESRVSFFTQDAEGNTWPAHEAWDMVQHRNLFYLQMDHDLRDVGAGFRVKYHLVGRALYEGIYDYGPSIYKDVKDENKDEVEDIAEDVDLWEGYVDISKGPVFFRLGKQNLSWGETDVFRLLDSINPLDETWGFQEELDDQRIPLWMVRGTYSLGRLGPFPDLSLEAFWVPGSIEDTVAPQGPDGTPFSLPMGDPHDLPPGATAMGSRLVVPEDDRWGVRLQATMADVSFSAAYYKTFLDLPGMRFVAEHPDISLFNPGVLDIESSWELVEIIGGTFNYWNRHTDIVFRGELAFIKDRPIQIPEINFPIGFIPSGFPPPYDFIPVFNTGQVPTKDYIDFMLGAEKSVWIRAINKSQMCFFILQYFGSYMEDYDNRAALAIPNPDNNNEPTTTKRLEQAFTLFASSEWKGRWGTSVVVAYQPRGAYMISPNVTHFRDPWRFKLQYTSMGGNWTPGIGWFRDRDMLFFQVAYLF